MVSSGWFPGKKEGKWIFQGMYDDWKQVIQMVDGKYDGESTISFSQMEPYV